MQNTQEFYKNLEEIVALAPEERHSYFQIQYFIIGKEPTTQAQMWKCLRELQARKNVIDSVNLQIEELQDKLELLDLRFAKSKLKESKVSKDPIKQKIKEKEEIIKNRQFERNRTAIGNSLRELQRTLTFTVQEARFFLQFFEELKKIEPLKDFDDLEAQIEYWNVKVAEKINLQMLLDRPLDMETAETALALPEEVPIRKSFENTLLHIQQQQKKLRDKYLKELEDHGSTQSN